ncbi:MAG: hypothetical protein IKP64_08980 [Selenomonadaceae bacterium]|nr:hypothetical protein [Selenomonadaceae bacterium]
MIDLQKLKYDLAMQSAVIMTNRTFDKGATGNPSDLMLTNFLIAYRQYSEPQREEKICALVKEISRSE